MNRPCVTCPTWLLNRLNESGGNLSFHKYMDLVLNDPENGLYGSGKVRIGKQGDFVTSPCLGPDFAELLAIQIVEWFYQLEPLLHKRSFSLVEFGPGEGDLVFNLINVFKDFYPEIFSKINFILVDINQSMIDKQKIKLSSFPKRNIFWLSLEELIEKPVVGVFLAHEVLDAFPVERLISHGDKIFRQFISKDNNVSHDQICYTRAPLNQELSLSIESTCDHLGIKIPPDNVDDGWTTEWHINLPSWFKKLSLGLESGLLLVVDYMLKSDQYFTKNRKNGTLIAYRDNKANSNLLLDPGCWDITSHLCIETLQYFAENNNFKCLGKVKQGQALLALGLADRLHSLQKSNNIKHALDRREALLSLVDPFTLGGFYWVAFQIVSNEIMKDKIKTSFLRDEIN